MFYLEIYVTPKSVNARTSIFLVLVIYVSFSCLYNIASLLALSVLPLVFFDLRPGPPQMQFRGTSTSFTEGSLVTLEVTKFQYLERRIL